MKMLSRHFRAATFFTVLLAAIAAPGPARAGWEDLAGTYAGPWKSTDTDGKSYSGTATVKIVSGPGNKVTLTVKTTLLGNPIKGSVKSNAAGKATYVVSNPILGTVTGTGKAKAGGSKGKLTGTAPLYSIGTATLAAKVQAKDDSLTAKGTLVRAFPFASATLTFSFSGKKK
ncbi:MAG TPA: hypothetical protein VIM61_10730 [Chthoniobacterales bacterium]|jgi:hypothetical protein